MSIFNNYFYHEMTRKYQIVFGSLFQDMQVRRLNSDNTKSKVLGVSVVQSSKEKFIQRLLGDVDQTYDGDDVGRRRTAITLPSIGYEMTDMSYDGSRKVAKTNYIRHRNNKTDSAHHTYVPAPYNLTFEVNIATATKSDMLQIIEQILPGFQPDFNITIIGIEGIEYDVPIDFNGISSTDSYEGSFEERRQIIWTLGFTMKAFYFAPVSKRTIILDVNASVHRLFEDLDMDNAELIETFTASKDDLIGQWEESDD